MHDRVIPRDLFNESKLLQQIGKLCLAIHDNDIQGIEFEHDGSPFAIALTDSGCLYVENIEFRLIESQESVCFFTSYNSRTANPLQYEYDGNGENYVFNDEGNFNPEFLKLA